MISCNECDGDCCKILVVEIKTPVSKQDFENIKFYLFHKDTNVYIDIDDCWNIQLNTQCKYSDEDGKCKIYDKRPPVCRDSKVRDCHRNKKDSKKFFNDLDEYEDWLTKHQA